MKKHTSHIFTLALLFTTTINPRLAHANEGENCGPKIAESNSGMVLYAICEPNTERKTCTKMINVSGGETLVDTETATPLRAEKAVVDEDSSDLVHVSLDSSSKCWMSNFTKQHINQTIATVVGDKVVMTPNIKKPIESGEVGVFFPQRPKNKKINCNAPSADRIFSDIYSFCQKIWTSCERPTDKEIECAKEEKKMQREKIVGDAQKFSEVMESSQWLPTGSSIDEYRDSELKEHRKTEYNISLQPILQEYNLKTKKFIYSDKAIKTISNVWINRQQIIPKNISQTEEELIKAINAGFLQKNCPDLSDYMFKISIANNILPSTTSRADYNRLSESAFRNAEVGLCAIKGAGACKKLLVEHESAQKKAGCGNLKELKAQLESKGLKAGLSTNANTSVEQKQEPYFRLKGEVCLYLSASCNLVKNNKTLITKCADDKDTLTIKQAKEDPKDLESLYRQYKSVPVSGGVYLENVDMFESKDGSSALQYYMRYNGKPLAKLVYQKGNKEFKGALAFLADCRDATNTLATDFY